MYHVLLLCVSVAVVQRVPTAAAWWDSECAVGGQCAAMLEAYEGVVQGDACRSIYVTGLCSGLCTRSLRAMIGRRLWARCADHCDWSAGVVAAADSWLNWCVSRPAEDARVPEVLNIEIRHGEKLPEHAEEPGHDLRAGNGRLGDKVAEGLKSDQAQIDGIDDAVPAGGRTSFTRQRVREPYNTLKGWLVSGGARLLALFVVLVICLPLAARRARHRGGSTRTRGYAAPDGLLGKARRGGGTSLLGHDLESLRRGARRHLKGSRNYLD
jgi:hypothetical protein